VRAGRSMCGEEERRGDGPLMGGCKPLGLEVCGAGLAGDVETAWDDARGGKTAPEGGRHRGPNLAQVRQQGLTFLLKYKLPHRLACAERDGERGVVGGWAMIAMGSRTL